VTVLVALSALVPVVLMIIAVMIVVIISLSRSCDDASRRKGDQAQ
jgi:hypothetical protein